MVNRNTFSIVLLLLLGGLLVFLGYQERGAPAGGPDTVAPSSGVAGTKVNAPGKGEAVRTPGDPLQGPAAQELKRKAGVEFFTEYRLERDRMRSRQLETLQELVNNPNSTTESRQEAQQQVLELTRAMGLEMQLENLVRAKGYQEAASLVQQGSVAVIVLAPAFGPEDSMRVAELAARTTGVKLEDIIIIPRS